MAAKTYKRINYKSDFILSLESDAGWMTPFCIKFWTGAPSLAYYASFDGTNYTHCTPDGSDPTKLAVQFDDHHLPCGELKYQVGYHFTVDDFPNDTEDEVINAADVITEIDGQQYYVMLDFNGETAPDIMFALPSYANEATRISNELIRQQNEQTRQDNEDTRQRQEATRQENERGRVQAEQAREAAEQARQAAYIANEGSKDSSVAGDGSRWGEYKAAENERDTEYQTAETRRDNQRLEAEGSASSEAGDGSRWGAYKTSEAQRDTAYQGAEQERNTANQTAEGSMADSVAGDGSRWGQYKEAENNRNTASSNAEGTSESVAGDGTRWGTYRTAEASRESAYETEEGSQSGSVAGDGSRWGAYKQESNIRSSESGILDVSKYNAVGGVPAEYESLASALAAVPQVYKAAGMTIKFIQSSDNKYVQYRFLLSSSFTDAQFANASNWQGIDNEVTKASKNLVTSGGVFGAINATKTIGYNAHRAGYGVSYSNGSLTSNSNYSCSDMISVSPGDIIYYKCANVSSNFSCVRYYTSMDDTTGTNGLRGNTTNESTLTVPLGVAYVRFTRRNNNDYTIKISRTIPAYQDYTNEEVEVAYDFSVKNYGIAYSTGEPDYNTNYVCTDFIAVQEDDLVHFVGYNSTQYSDMYLYDAQKAPTNSWYKGGNISHTLNLRVPAGVAYIRATSQEEETHSLSITTTRSLEERLDADEIDIEHLKPLAKRFLSFAGKRIAVIGDSISTGRSMSAYITIKPVDVGNVIQSYVTYYDVYTSGGSATGKTIGGVALTEAMIGTLQTFTPVEADVDKRIGVGVAYYSDNNGWAYKLCEKVGATLINASWSGASLTSGQGDDNDTGALKKKLSHGWSDLTIGRCRVRDSEGNYINPDIVIIYRGTNDFSHSPYARLDSDYDLAENGYPETDLYDTDKYGFYRAYYLTIAKIREAYPNAVIYCCTLNTFKRMTRDRFPVRQSTSGAPGYSVLDYNKAIRDIANTMSCGLIEFDKDGITFENCYPTYISDSADMPAHPNATGQLVMANRALMDMRYLIQTN